MHREHFSYLLYWVTLSRIPVFSSVFPSSTAFQSLTGSHSIFLIGKVLNVANKAKLNSFLYIIFPCFMLRTFWINIPVLHFWTLQIWFEQVVIVVHYHNYSWSGWNLGIFYWTLPWPSNLSSLVNIFGWRQNQAKFLSISWTWNDFSD